MSERGDAVGERDSRERAERLFEELRFLEPAARAARIHEACAGDAALEAELQSLLVHADAAERFFELLGEVVIAPELTRGVIGGRYEIRTCIGMGGMGAVYRARDSVLERDVALKFLTPHPAGGADTQRRLLNEARAAAALEHTNVCTVHEVGEAGDGRFFISMAFYEGETLKERLAGGPLSVRDAVDVARQIARGLGAAHAHGIVHGDVKPGNVMILPDGTVKLLDFGVAHSSDAHPTGPATLHGTAAYMSPEHVRGDDVDARSDLFSLGVVLYEMLAGRNPFRRGSDHLTLHAILHDEPELLRAGDPSLQRIVTRLLQKRATERYPDVQALIADLDLALTPRARSLPARLRMRLTARGRRFAVAGVTLFAAAGVVWLIRGPVSSPPASAAVAELDAASAAASNAIAVLPFTNVNRDAEQDYLVDGLTEELIGALSRVRALRVVARTSAFAYRGTTQDIREIGRALNVGTIVEGSVQKVEDNIRVRAQLINVADGLHLWSETYDYRLTDILALQRDLALRITAALETELSAADRRRLADHSTTNPEAYAAYLKGRHFWNQRTPGGFSRAIEQFQHAIRLDSGFAAAYAGLAAAYSLQGIWSRLSPGEAGSRMQAAARRAVELDGGSAEAHSVLGVYHHVYEWDTEAAERQQLRAIELDPRYVTARYFYGNLLRSNGRIEEALAQYRVAAVLDPLDPNIFESLSTALLLAGRYQEAHDQLSIAMELDSMFWGAHAGLAEYHEVTGNLGEALRLYRRALDLQGVEVYRVSVEHARVLAQLGRETEARQELAELQAQAAREALHSPIVATLLLALGDRDAALAWLEQSYRDRHPQIRFIGGKPSFRPFETDPRYIDLLRRIGLRR